MITYNEVAHIKQQEIEFDHYSIRLSVVLSLILSLATVFILSKQHLLDHRALYAAGLVLPISCLLYFRRQIVRAGSFAYVATLVAMLVIGSWFGI